MAPDQRWRQLRADVSRVVARRLSPADLEDIVQEVLVRVWRHAAEIRDQERSGASPARVAHWAAADDFCKRDSA
jgi:DNA-directed RNA polymerase specialized sigma24 family protein